MRRKLFYVFGILLVLSLAYVLFPATLAMRLFGPQQDIVELEGIQGRVWNGSADNLVALGQSLGAPKWELDPLSTLLFKPSGTLQLKGQFVQADAIFKKYGSTLRLEKTKASFPANMLGPALDIPALLMMGRVAVDFAELELDQGLPVIMNGTVRWTELETGGAAALRLPGVQVVFLSQRGSKIEGIVTDLGGPLAISGTVAIEADQYHAEVNLNAREMNSQLKKALQYVGQLQADGSSKLIIDGKVRRL